MRLLHWSKIASVNYDDDDIHKDVKKRAMQNKYRTKTNLTLSDVESLAKASHIEHIKIDKRTGKAWIYVEKDTLNLDGFPFHFPPNESLHIMKNIQALDKNITLEFVNKMDMIGDLKNILPKAVIGFGFLLTVRIGLNGLISALDHQAPVMRPKTAVARPPERLQNSWARSRLRPTPPVIKQGGQMRTVTFGDVAGLAEAKRELSELVTFLKDPQRFHDMGARIPRGALLSGPPGTGKTLLAKAVAGEAEVPFFSLSGSDFMEVYVGVGASRVRELFQEARKSLNGAILFIDEIDAIGRKRSTHAGNGASDERENTLNQLLIEMDGFSENENVIVIAASNRCDTLDSALTRPGRFDRTIVCDLPTVKDRQSILSCHLKNIRCDLSLDGTSRPFESYQGQYDQMSPQELNAREAWCARIGALTPGFSGADLSNVVNEAAILAARKARNGVILSDLEESVERTAFGLEKGGELPTRKRLKKTAYHEAGHAIVGWVLANTEPPIKLSIVPRKSGVLGYAQQIPSEESLDTRDAIKDKLAVLMGGRIAEELIYGQGSTGAEDDLQKATALANAYVSSWGFAPDEAGLISPSSKHYQHMNISPETQLKIDRAVNELLHEAQDRSRQVLNEYQAVFKDLAEALMRQETLAYNDLRTVIGFDPIGEMSEAFKHYLKHELDTEVSSKVQSSTVKGG